MALLHINCLRRDGSDWKRTRPLGSLLMASLKVTLLTQSLREWNRSVSPHCKLGITFNTPPPPFPNALAPSSSACYTAMTCTEADLQLFCWHRLSVESSSKPPPVTHHIWEEVWDLGSLSAFTPIWFSFWFRSGLEEPLVLPGASVTIGGGLLNAQCSFKILVFLLTQPFPACLPVPHTALFCNRCLQVSLETREMPKSQPNTLFPPETTVYWGQ